MQTDALQSGTSVPTFHGNLMEPARCSQTSVYFYQMSRRHAAQTFFYAVEIPYASHEGNWCSAGITDFIGMHVFINIISLTAGLMLRHLKINSPSVRSCKLA